jgi:orotate phosphoribosyltransferase
MRKDMKPRNYIEDPFPPITVWLDEFFEETKETGILKNELIRLLLKKSFKFSDKPIFKLVSGGMSHFYVNCKPVILDPRGMYLVGNLVFWEVQKNPEIVAVGGLTFGADPIAVATSYASGCFKSVKAFSIRKELKQHGTSQWIEGDLQKGDKVAIIDDVVTTGGSTIKAIVRAREEGLEVVKVVVLVDREEDNGIEKIKQYCDDVTSIVTIHDLMKFN